MVNYILRDYAPATTGYNANYFHFSYLYLMPMFLYRVLGFSVIGSTGLNYDTTFRTLTVSGATNATPIQITTSTAHGLTSGTQGVFISGVGGNTNANGNWTIDVTGSNTFTLRGSSGNAAFTSGGTVTAGFLYASGLIADGYGTGINFGTGVEKEVAIPIEKRKVVVGDVGKIMVLKSTKFPTKNAGLFKISAINVGNSTTIAVGSNGQSLPQSTINVVSTTGFPASGTIFVTTSTGSYAVTYTGTTATTFTGCAGGTGTMSTGGAVSNLNRYVLDYRSTENPPAEPINTIDWWLYEIENSADDHMYQASYNNGYTVSAATNTSPIAITNSAQHGYTTGQIVTITGAVGNTAANGTWVITVTGLTTFTLNGSTGNGTYTGGGVTYLDGNISSGASPTPRIILQSPHSTGWQVRICGEYRFSNLPVVSVATGFSGNSLGDFPKGTAQTHSTSFFDANSVRAGLYGNMTPGGGEINTAISRLTMVGDGYGRSVFVYTRAGSNNGILKFGIPENEPTPTPPDAERIFCYGSTNGAVAASYVFGGIALRIGASLNTGLSFKGIPRFCTLSSWANLDGTSATSPMFSANAGDSAFTASTELLPIEIWAGAIGDVGLTTGVTPPFTFDQAFMGTPQFLRVGRSNFGNFTLTTEEVTSRTVTAATNATPIQITTSVANALTTGQTVTISGVGGNTAANGTWTITVINNQNFTLDGSVGNGTYTSGGTVNGTPRWLHLQNGLYLKWDGASGLTP